MVVVSKMRCESKDGEKYDAVSAASDGERREQDRARDEDRHRGRGGVGAG
jgi:hypothetical protein